MVFAASLEPAEVERALKCDAAVILNKLTDLDQVLATVKHLRDQSS